jgi:hypothetical protein
MIPMKSNWGHHTVTYMAEEEEGVCAVSLCVLLWWCDVLIRLLECVEC